MARASAKAAAERSGVWNSNDTPDWLPAWGDNRRSSALTKASAESCSSVRSDWAWLGSTAGSSRSRTLPEVFPATWAAGSCSASMSARLGSQPAVTLPTPTQLNGADTP